MKMIERAEAELSKNLNDVVWLVKIRKIYRVQRVENGDLNRYEHLGFLTLRDVFEFCAGY